jgi:hypothetical protein
MRYKVAPPPRSISDLQQIRRAIPLVPDDELDCCLSIQRTADIGDREQARQYLTFLRALALVATDTRGYYRTQDEFDIKRINTAYRNNVFLVAELCSVASSDPDEAFEAVRNKIPQWERERQYDWETTWRERVQNLLKWGQTFGCEPLTPAERR